MGIFLSKTSTTIFSHNYFDIYLLGHFEKGIIWAVLVNSTTVTLSQCLSPCKRSLLSVFISIDGSTHMYSNTDFGQTA